MRPILQSLLHLDCDFAKYMVRQESVRAGLEQKLLLSTLLMKIKVESS